jgi:hypothetical protein
MPMSPTLAHSDYIVNNKIILFTESKTGRDGLPALRTSSFCVHAPSFRLSPVRSAGFQAGFRRGAQEIGDLLSACA